MKEPSPPSGSRSAGDGIWSGLDGLGLAMVTASPLPILAIDDDQLMRVVNPAAVALLGIPAAELLGAPVAGLFPPEEAATTLARALDAVEHDLGHLEFEVVTAGGDRTPVGMSFAPLVHEGRRIGILAIGRDISRRRALEHEAEQLAASFRALAESSEVGMYRFSFHPGLRVDHVNPAFAAALGYSGEELAVDASPLETRLDPADAQRFIANRRSAVPSWPLEFDWTRPDGSSLVFSVTEVPIRTREGELQAVLGIARDVTAERQARHALSESLDMEREIADRLRHVDELRRLFLQAVSHELRTPLTLVTGFAATLRERVTELDPDQVVQISGRLYAQAAKLEALLDDLLDIERMSRGVAALQLEALDVAEVVGTIIDEEGIPGVRFTGRPAVAHIDRSKLERIVVNLLSNAQRHAGDGAVIHVEVTHGTDHVRLSVEDDGPGIPEELRGRVFEAFEQGPAASDAASPGTGIGLTLVAEFTRLHHGTVRIEEATLGGARFVVELPVAAPGSSAGGPPVHP